MAKEAHLRTHELSTHRLPGHQLVKMGTTGQGGVGHGLLVGESCRASMRPEWSKFGRSKVGVVYCPIGQ